MSKKLIAVAAAAALALTGLVATPANATTITDVKINTNETVADGGATTASHFGTTSVSPVTYMSTRKLGFDATGTTTRAVIRFDVTTSAATTLTISGTGGVFVSADLNDSAGDALSVTAGVQSLSGLTTSDKLIYTFYAFNNSTTAGKLTIASPGSTNSYNIKGLEGTPYSITDVKFPVNIVSGVTEAASTAIISFQLKDAYGNATTTANPSALTVAALGASVSSATYNTTRKQYEAIVFGTATTNVAMSVSLTASDLSANGFAKPVLSAFSATTGASLADQLTAANAQVTALTAQLANSRGKDVSVTKKKYNTLARKWNAANPTARVALKK